MIRKGNIGIVGNGPGGGKSGTLSQTYIMDCICDVFDKRLKIEAARARFKTLIRSGLCHTL